MIFKVKVVFEDGTAVPATIRLRGFKKLPKGFGQGKKLEGGRPIFFKRWWKWILEKIQIGR